MPFAGLMLSVSHQSLLVAETGCKLFGIYDFSAAIAAYIQNHTLTEH